MSWLKTYDLSCFLKGLTKDMGGRPGKGNNDDTELWRFVTQTVRPFNRRKVAPTPAKADPDAVKMRPAASVPQQVSPPRNTVRQPPGIGLDTATRTKLKKGQLPIEARLDLHGMTQEEAYAALRRFIRIAEANRARTLLVITGKGRVGGGVLRRMTPLWLAESDLKDVVLTIVPARPKDGGEGAFYIRLRNPDKK
jgi:DNA-nicking Smr family endonuclease